MAPTIPVFTLDLDAVLKQISMQELAAGALSRYRTDVGRTRSLTSSDVNARSTGVVFFGDSLTEAFSPTVRGLMWPLHVARRLNGSRMGSVQYIPAAANTFSTVDAASWPGSQAPWVFSASPTGDVTRGADLHASIMQSGSTATINFYGDVITVFYTRSTGGPAAAAVTLDGVAQATLAANGTEVNGLSQPYVADGYGYHTLVVTSTSGQLILEGAVVTDNEISAFGVPCRMVRTLTFGHAGFQSGDFISRPNWANSFVTVVANQATGTYPSLIVIGLGANDQGGSVPTATYEANLLSIMATMDAKLDAAGITTDPGFLLIAFPSQNDAYVDSMWKVRQAYGTGRVGVLDLRRYYVQNATTPWDVNVSGSHPGDGGQDFIAETIADFIDGRTNIDQPRYAPATSRGDVTISAVTPPDFRLAWAQSLATVSATNGTWRDATPASSTVSERRHRMWFEPGTYTPALRYGEVTTTGGEWQVLVRGISLGTTGATTGTTGNVVGTALSATVTIDSPGPYPVVIRKTGLNAGAAHFVDLVLRKTA